MDWHTTDSWTGYSWNRELFPDPRGFLAWLHDEHLHTTLNLHPALGVQAFEDAYPAFAAAMGADPAAGEAVPFRIGDRDFVRHYLELLHHPLEEEGVDFWWIDWQQGEASEIRGLDPLPWLNHLHFADMARREGVRPLIFSRWGGLGSHRYPVGFSGDSFSLWPALRFQPHYTSAGANVAYAWWSHDIGGHVGAVDPELYVRWVQFGALSPVLRLHSTNDPDYERLPWKFGDGVLDAARAAFRLRYELVPYLYTAARIASDTGVAPVRPVSWTAPEHDGAYLARGEYLFGDAILAAPVLHPADPDTGLATVDAWLPPGDWLERTTGESFTGPRWVRLVAGLDRVPQFVRPGTALALAPVAQSTADQPDDHRILEVWPGDGTARLYDDDDVWTTVTVAAPCTVRIAGGVAARRYTVRVRGVARPAAVAFDGAAVAWEHDGETLTVELPGAGELRVDAEPAYGPAHDAAVRAADLRRLAGTDDVDAIRAMTPVDPAALARIGGPAVQVLEATAPEDAAAALGHVIVAAAEHGPPVEASVVWTLERGGAAEEHAAGPVTVAGDAAVFEAPFAWDGTFAPLRWTATVTARWGDVVVEHEHRAEVVCPTIAAWEGAVADAADHAAPAWADWTAGAGSIDFPELTAPAVLSFPDLATGVPARRPRRLRTHDARRRCGPRRGLLLRRGRRRRHRRRRRRDRSRPGRRRPGAVLHARAGTAHERAGRADRRPARGRLQVPGAGRGEGARLVPVGERGRPRRRRRAAGRRPGLTVTMGGCRARPPRCCSCSRSRAAEARRTARRRRRRPAGRGSSTCGRPTRARRSWPPAAARGAARPTAGSSSRSAPRARRR